MQLDGVDLWRYGRNPKWHLGLEGGGGVHVYFKFWYTMYGLQWLLTYYVLATHHAHAHSLVVLDLQIESFI